MTKSPSRSDKKKNSYASSSVSSSVRPSVRPSVSPPVSPPVRSSVRSSVSSSDENSIGFGVNVTYDYDIPFFWFLCVFAVFALPWFNPEIYNCNTFLFVVAVGAVFIGEYFSLEIKIAEWLNTKPIERDLKDVNWMWFWFGLVGVSYGIIYHCNSFFLGLFLIALYFSLDFFPTRTIAILLKLKSLQPLYKYKFEFAMYDGYWYESVNLYTHYESIDFKKFCVELGKVSEHLLEEKFNVILKYNGIFLGAFRLPYESCYGESSWYNENRQDMTSLIFLRDLRISYSRNDDIIFKKIITVEESWDANVQIFSKSYSRYMVAAANRKK